MMLLLTVDIFSVFGNMSEVSGKFTRQMSRRSLMSVIRVGSPATHVSHIPLP